MKKEKINPLQVRTEYTIMLLFAGIIVIIASFMLGV